MDERNRIRVRVEQVRPALGDVEENAGTALDALDRAHRDGVDLLVFPELFLTGYHLEAGDPDALASDAERAVEELAERATDVTAVVGLPFRDGGTLHNSAAVVDQGEVVGVYHKVHLYDEEASTFTPGDEISAFGTSAGTLGVQVCYDAEFPETARELTLAGADVLVTISANMRPFARDQSTYLAARAMENVRPHVLCNRIGEEEGVEFFGASGLVDERGRVVARAGEDVSLELTGEVDLDSGGAETLQYVHERRPETYRRT